MNKFSLIAKIEDALDKCNIEIDGALSIDMPFDNKTDQIFVYDMSYSTFVRKLVAIYSIATDTVEKINF